MPGVQKYAAGKGVVWLAVNTSADGDRAAKAAAVGDWLKAKGATPAATIMDTGGAIGKAYGARTTPHMYLIDPSGKLVYAGAIDSKPTANPADIKTATNYVVQWTANGSPTQIYLPPAGEIDSLLASTGASITGDYTPGTSSQLFNASWGLSDGAFGWAATIPQPNPIDEFPYALTLPSASDIFLANIAASLQTALRAIIVGTTVTVAGSVIAIDTGDNARTFRFPTYRELKDIAWKRANWPDIRDYSIVDPQAYNELMPLPSPSVSARVTTLGAFPPTRRRT
jgi:hypothetical protein